jgi:hypothetical protein
MVSEARQTEFSMLGIGQLARTGQSMAPAPHAQAGVSSGSLDEYGFSPH